VRQVSWAQSSQPFLPQPHPPTCLPGTHAPGACLPAPRTSPAAMTCNFGLVPHNGACVCPAGTWRTDSAYCAPVSPGGGPRGPWLMGHRARITAPHMHPAAWRPCAWRPCTWQPAAKHPYAHSTQPRRCLPPASCLPLSARKTAHALWATTIASASAANLAKAGRTTTTAATAAPVACVPRACQRPPRAATGTQGGGWGGGGACQDQAVGYSPASGASGACKPSRPSPVILQADPLLTPPLPRPPTAGAYAPRAMATVSMAARPAQPTARSKKALPRCATAAVRAAPASGRVARQQAAGSKRPLH
jgi:hypothetical protein